MNELKRQIGRHLSFVECREAMGLGIGGALAQRATISDSGRDVVAVAMGPGKRHITKPVCEITYALREEGIDTSVLVVNAGSGVPSDAPDVTTGSRFGLDPLEVERLRQFKVVVIHLGNVRNHIIYKARLILRNVDLPAIIVSQCPVDFEDFAAIGIKTEHVMPPDDEIKTQGYIVDIITGVIRGITCPQEKLDEIVSKVQSILPRGGSQ
ncbi:MAG TPA: methyl-coenzyme M reductase I operon protein C [Candidatus Methanomethylophilaceae archaeon]|nr:methyl-coenzyme M reductase I operon protein C [Candidatus Methanomethylophilaceae archaeon]